MEVKKEIRVYTLANGIDLVTEVEEREASDGFTTHVSWIRPMAVQPLPDPKNPGRGSISFIPMSSYVEDEKVEPNLSQVLFSGKAKPGIAKSYEAAVDQMRMQRSNIVPPSARDVAKAGASKILS